jgi:hypothetical protein
MSENRMFGFSLPVRDPGDRLGVPRALLLLSQFRDAKRNPLRWKLLPHRDSDGLGPHGLTRNANSTTTSLDLSGRHCEAIRAFFACPPAFTRAISDLGRIGNLLYIFVLSQFRIDIDLSKHRDRNAKWYALRWKLL